METKREKKNIWRIWVDTKRKIVSFHEEEGCEMLEFRSREMFINCVDQYTCRQFRYHRYRPPEAGDCWV